MTTIIPVRASFEIQDGWARPLGTPPTHTAPYDPIRPRLVRAARPHHRSHADLALAKIELARLGEERKAKRVAEHAQRVSIDAIRRKVAA